MKSRDGKSQRREEKKKEDHKRESLRRKKIQVREKAGKSRNTAFFKWFVAPEGRKVGSLKGCGAMWPDERWKIACRCGAKHISKSKCTKHTILGPFLEVEMSKKSTPLWRSTFPSQNVQNTTCSRHFWRFGCWKSARRCGAKHISKSKCAKHTRFGALFEVEMLKKSTPLWREAHFQVKMLKTPHVRTTFGRSDVVLRGRRKGLCTWSKINKTWGFCSSFNYNHHYATPHCTPLHSTALHYTTKITLHYTTLH